MSLLITWESLLLTETNYVNFVESFFDTKVVPMSMWQ